MSAAKKFAFSPEESRLTTLYGSEFDRCRSLTHSGQACWAEWNTDARAPCSTCAHFYKTRKKHGVQVGRCLENERLNNKRGNEIPTTAKACHYFKGASDAP